jgi:phosphinothricin acetyltransferase
MQLLNCSREHALQILDILNEAIANSTALYDYKPRTMQNMELWFENKEKGSFPVIGLFNDEDILVGFGSYGSFRAWPAYQYTVEHSLYVHRDFRGNGYGRIILSEIIAQAQKQNYHNLIAGIDSTNQVSIALHRSLGFEQCGIIKHAGYKFSRWLDLAFYQLILSTPLNPVEDQ